MTDPRVSVVITTYNRADLLPRAVDSVLQQRYALNDIEIVLVDDGSTDNTRQLVADRYGHVPTVRYFHKPNGGINSASQYGIRQARGEIVAQLDSDDYWYPNKLATCVPMFDRADDVVAVLHDLDVVQDSTGQKKGTWFGSAGTFLTPEPQNVLPRYLAGESIKAITSGALWRRAALEKVLPIPEGLWGFHDAYFMRNVMFYGRYCGTSECLGAYVLHDSNDYGGVGPQTDDAKLARLLRECKVMSDSFNRRCAEFNVPLASRRHEIQKFAVAELELERLRRADRGQAVGWVLRNDLQLSNHARVQLMTNLVLPPRLASFVKARVLSRLGALD
ncbi:glycosyltransferase family 2 protein [Aquabacterium sp.]|uniref:glycosyltransferase family 2 protein n=1 Tax=Aquabacterium sp. TaxID=1872578 RepID=UPI0035B40AF2